MATMYPIIKEYILNNIKEGVFKEGAMLPPEKIFTAKFNVSRMTVRRAFDELIQDGILVRKKGQSVYVAKKKMPRSISRLSISSNKELIQEFGPIRIEVLGLKIVKDHPVANELLEISSEEEVWQLKRVQLGWDIPIVYEIIYFPRKYFEDFTKEECEQSISNFVSSKLKEKGNIKNKVEVNATNASVKIAELLSVERNGPLLQLDNICYDVDGTRIYCGRDYYDGNTFKYCEK
ncbi:MAG: GntR family transcriptional regulator [Coprobacillaceae bacterium]